jgi:drug/metabolite transporter (DMT)-like permease
MWVILALGSALMLSISDVFAKRLLARIDPWSAAWIKLAGAAVVTLPLWVTAARPPLWPFAGYLALAVPLELLALYGYHVALQRAHLSRAVPMLAFTPVFLLGVGFVFLGEAPSLAGALGVVLVAGGAYLLYLSPGEGVLAPLTAAWRDPGARSMLGVALVYAFTSSLGKKLVALSSPQFFGGFYPLILALTLAPAGLAPARRTALRSVPPLAALGLAVAYGAMMALHFAAVARAPVAYMIAVKRTSLVFAVVWGRVVFGEPAFGRRFVAAAIMALGVALLAASPF